MDKQELQKLRDLPIEGVAERLGLQVSKHKCLCPFHDDHHASLSFSVRRNRYRCFVCEASGGTIDLVMHLLNKDFKDACRWLADANNVLVQECTQSAAMLFFPPIASLIGWNKIILFGQFVNNYQDIIYVCHIILF